MHRSGNLLGLESQEITTMRCAW